MSDLKNQVFALLKKRPTMACVTNQIVQATYHPNESTRYDISLFKDSFNKPYMMNVLINENLGTFAKNVEITEKEFMELKWIVDDWAATIKSEVFERFKDFAEPAEPTAMDDLLND